MPWLSYSADLRHRLWLGASGGDWMSSILGLWGRSLGTAGRTICLTRGCSGRVGWDLLTAWYASAGSDSTVMWLDSLRGILLDRLSLRENLLVGLARWGVHIIRDCVGWIVISLRWGWAMWRPGRWPSGDQRSTACGYMRQRTAAAHAPTDWLTDWFVVSEWGFAGSDRFIYRPWSRFSETGWEQSGIQFGLGPIQPLNA